MYLRELGNWNQKTRNHPNSRPIVGEADVTWRRRAGVEVVGGVVARPLTRLVTRQLEDDRRLPVS